MKKLMMILAMLALTLTLSNETFAQGGKKQHSKQARTNFVDANGDGVCDNAGTNASQGKRVNFVDADGDGVCDNAGTGLGKGKRTNFVDANGDGVCDNAANPIKQQLRDGTGTGSGNKGKKRGGSK